MIFFVALLLLIAGGALYEIVAARRDHVNYPPPGKLVAVGDFRLHLNCLGRGTPTVVLDAGLGDSSMVWAGVQDALAMTQRVCSYDRAGIAWSEPGPSPRTAQQAVEELHTLLHNAGERPPYVLVGHSAGVNQIRLFAHAYPEAVAGLVLIEPPLLTEVSPTFVVALTTLRRAIGLLARVGVVRLLGKAGWMGFAFGGVTPPRALAERAGFLYNGQSIRASLAEIAALPETIRLVNQAATPGAWRDWPVQIIAAYGGNSPSPELETELNQLAQLSSQGRVTFVKSSHFVHFEQPQTVVELIRATAELKPELKPESKPEVKP